MPGVAAAIVMLLAFKLTLLLTLTWGLESVLGRVNKFCFQLLILRILKMYLINLINIQIIDYYVRNDRTRFIETDIL